MGREGSDGNGRETKIPRLSSVYAAGSPVRISARGTSLAIHQSTNAEAAQSDLDEGSKPLLLQGREEDHFANGPLTRQEHGQTVDPDADATGRRHAVFQGEDVVLVERRGVLVARRGVPDLLLETLAMSSRADLVGLGLNSGAYVHYLAEAFRGAMADRIRAIGDPAFTTDPMGELLDPRRLQARRARIAMERTSALPESTVSRCC